jgi:hypothetical protein
MTHLNFLMALNLEHAYVLQRLAELHYYGDMIGVVQRH